MVGHEGLADVASICCSPPDRSPASCWYRSRRPGGTAASTRALRPRPTPAPFAAWSSRPGTEVSFTVSVEEHRLRPPGIITMPCSTIDVGRPCWARRPPSKSTSPWTPARRPVMTLNSVDFPAPLVPRRATISPSLDGEVQAEEDLDAARTDGVDAVLRLEDNSPPWSLIGPPPPAGRSGAALDRSHPVLEHDPHVGPPGLTAPTSPAGRPRGAQVPVPQLLHGLPQPRRQGSTGSASSPTPTAPAAASTAGPSPNCAASTKSMPRKPRMPRSAPAAWPARRWRRRRTPRSTVDRPERPLPGAGEDRRRTAPPATPATAPARDEGLQPTRGRHAEGAGEARSLSRVRDDHPARRAVRRTASAAAAASSRPATASRQDVARSLGEVEPLPEHRPHHLRRAPSWRS